MGARSKETKVLQRRPMPAREAWIVRAARVGDQHVCSMMTGVMPHVGGVLLVTGRRSVLIDGRAAVCRGDLAQCADGSFAGVLGGSPTVLIDGAPAARSGDQTTHAGAIVSGSESVTIGDAPVFRLGPPGHQNSASKAGAGEGVQQGLSGADSDPTIERLDLDATARRAAYELKRQFRSVVFTSGRRSRDEQAGAMAQNVVRNRAWIRETYAKHSISEACQKWVDEHPSAATRADIKAGLLSVFSDYTDAELTTLSKHLSGRAFDVHPVEQDAAAIKQAIRSLNGVTKFLEHEGGLVIWHVQF